MQTILKSALIRKWSAKNTFIYLFIKYCRGWDTRSSTVPFASSSRPSLNLIFMYVELMLNRNAVNMDYPAKKI